MQENIMKCPFNLVQVLKNTTNGNSFVLFDQKFSFLQKQMKQGFLERKKASENPTFARGANRGFDGC